MKAPLIVCVYFLWLVMMMEQNRHEFIVGFGSILAFFLTDSVDWRICLGWVAICKYWPATQLPEIMQCLCLAVAY